MDFWVFLYNITPYTLVLCTYNMDFIGFVSFLHHCWISLLPAPLLDFLPFSLSWGSAWILGFLSPAYRSGLDFIYSFSLHSDFSLPAACCHLGSGVYWEAGILPALPGYRNSPAWVPHPTYTTGSLECTCLECLFIFLPACCLGCSCSDAIVLCFLHSLPHYLLEQDFSPADGVPFWSGWRTVCCLLPPATAGLLDLLGDPACLPACHPPGFLGDFCLGGS